MIGLDDGYRLALGCSIYEIGMAVLVVFIVIIGCKLLNFKA